MIPQTEPIVPSRPRRTRVPVALVSSLPIVALTLALVLILAATGPAAGLAQASGQTPSGQSAASQMESGRSQGAKPDAPMAEEPQTMEQQTPAEEAAATEPAEPGTPAAIETAQAVVAADQALSQAVEDGDKEAFGALLADNAVFLSAQGTLQGRDAIVAGWASLMAEDRTATLTWAPRGARVATSRDLAYSVGTYTLTVPRPDDDPLQSQGQYITVWTRDVEADGPWKVLFDGPMRRGYAAYLERALGEQGRIGPKTGVDLTFVPERLVTAKADDLSVTYGSYQAKRIDLDGTEHPVADGSWFSVWATNPEATPDEATRLLPAGDSVTPPPPPVTAGSEGMKDNGEPADEGMDEG